ncbi:sigma 54-interacting transcriptional regulator [Lachnospiraceae bacterium ZAX-1]
MKDSNYLGDLKKARDMFFGHGKAPYDLIDNEIVDSWVRSRSYHLTPEDIHPPLLSLQALYDRRNSNKALYEIAKSFMEYLYTITKDSDFAIIFADADGYVLELIGDPNIMHIAACKGIPLTEGALRSERAIGTNAIGTPLTTQNPIQLYADEHYASLSSDWTCSGAPILLDNELLGVLCISGHRDKVHLHTLGMALAASEAIVRQLSIHRANKKAITMKNQLQTAIDSLHVGTFLLDENYNITSVNSLTLRVLETDSNDIIGTSYKVFFPELDLLSRQDNIYDEATVFQSNTETLEVYVNVKYVSSSSYTNNESCLITFRRAEYIQKLVNKVIGSDAHYNFNNIIGTSHVMENVKQQARLVANTNTNILITGESGTGKELFAQSIHNSSPFRGGPFIAINCGALPKDLVESELFGYDSGAFTGAKKEGRAGKFELANNGTIFLDEIGDMPYEVQVKLLRVIQEKKITRVGGTKAISLNVRIITATNVDLGKAIESHTFRSDLYYRLNVFNISIPPLRNRDSDIMLLAVYFIEKYQNPNYEPITYVDSTVKEAFIHYPWPGNIRELENIIERACILTIDGKVSLSSIPDNIKNYVFHNNSISSSRHSSDNLICLNPSMKDTLSASEAEKALIIEHIQCSHGNIKKASDSLGINRRTLYRKIQKYSIDIDMLRF